MHWIQAYSKAKVRDDLVAAIIVTVMLIPQSLAYAMLAGLPAEVGLYASILPLIAYAVFGTSMTLAVGPVAVVSLMTATAVGAVTTPGTDNYLAATVLLALMSGGFLMVLGFLRAGFMANLLSHPVISGFISASAILIAASQLKHLIGVPTSGHTLPQLIQNLWQNLDQFSPATLVLGLLCLGFLAWVRSGLAPVLRRLGLSDSAADLLAKLGPMLAVILSTLAVYGWELDQQGIAIVGHIPAGLPMPSVPNIDWGLVTELWPAAVLISLIGFVESVSVGHTLAAKRRERIQPNRELLGLGAANLASGLGGGFPVTGGFSRSVVNYDAGARTPMAGVFTSVLIGITALFLTGLFTYLPKAVLAATVIVAVMSLVDLKSMRHVMQFSAGDSVAMFMTIGAVLVLGVEAGIIAGVLCSIVCLLSQVGRPHIAELGNVTGTEHYRNIDRHEVDQTQGVVALRFDERLHFLNARLLEDQVSDVIGRPDVRHVVLHSGAINQIDASGLETLEAINDRLQTAGIDFHLSEVKGPVLDRLQRSNFLSHLTGQVHLTHHQAMQALSA